MHKRVCYNTQEIESVMKKQILVKQTHRYSLQTGIMYEGEAFIDEYSDYIRFTFIDDDEAKVVFYCFEQYMEIHRFGEVNSELLLKPNAQTFNKITSEFGKFDVEIKTIAYQNNDMQIRVEYDIESDQEDKDGFIIDIEVMEGNYEYN